jgi:hypothetical protein
MQQMPRIVPGLAEAHGLPHARQEQLISLVHFSQETGGLVGRFVMAALLVTWLARRQVLRGFQLPALVLIPLLFLSAPHLDVRTLAAASLVAGLLYNGLINFIGVYAPQLYPTHLRGVGEGFAVSVGGRMVGASGALLTPWLANFTPGSDAAGKLAFAAAGVAAAACLLGLVTSVFLIEPDGRGGAD